MSSTTQKEVSVSSTQNAAPCTTLRLVQNPTRFSKSPPIAASASQHALSQHHQHLFLRWCFHFAHPPVSCCSRVSSSQGWIKHGRKIRGLGCLGYAVCHCNSIDLHIVLPKNLRTHGDPHKAPKTQGLSQLSSSTGAALLSGACSTPAALQPWQEPFSTRIHSKHAGRLGHLQQNVVSWASGVLAVWPWSLKSMPSP